MIAERLENSHHRGISKELEERLSLQERVATPSVVAVNATGEVPDLSVFLAHCDDHRDLAASILYYYIYRQWEAMKQQFLLAGDNKEKVHQASLAMTSGETLVDLLCVSTLNQSIGFLKIFQEALPKLINKPYQFLAILTAMYDPRILWRESLLAPSEFSYWGKLHFQALQKPFQGETSLLKQSFYQLAVMYLMGVKLVSQFMPQASNEFIVRTGSDKDKDQDVTVSKPLDELLQLLASLESSDEKDCLIRLFSQEIDRYFLDGRMPGMVFCVLMFHCSSPELLTECLQNIGDKLPACVETYEQLLMLLIGELFPGLVKARCDYILNAERIQVLARALPGSLRVPFYKVPAVPQWLPKITHGIAWLVLVWWATLVSALTSLLRLSASQEVQTFDDRDVALSSLLPEGGGQFEERAHLVLQQCPNILMGLTGDIPEIYVFNRLMNHTPVLTALFSETMNKHLERIQQAQLNSTDEDEMLSPDNPYAVWQSLAPLVEIDEEIDEASDADEEKEGTESEEADQGDQEEFEDDGEREEVELEESLVEIDEETGEASDADEEKEGTEPGEGTEEADQAESENDDLSLKIIHDSLERSEQDSVSQLYYDAERTPTNVEEFIAALERQGESIERVFYYLDANPSLAVTFVTRLHHVRACIEGLSRSCLRLVLLFASDNLLNMGMQVELSGYSGKYRERLEAYFQQHNDGLSQEHINIALSCFRFVRKRHLKDGLSNQKSRLSQDFSSPLSLFSPDKSSGGTRTLREQLSSLFDYSGGTGGELRSRLQDRLREAHTDDPTSTVMLLLPFMQQADNDYNASMDEQAGMFGVAHEHPRPKGEFMTSMMLALDNCLQKKFPNGFRANEDGISTPPRGAAHAGGGAPSFSNSISPVSVHNGS